MIPNTVVYIILFHSKFLKRAKTSPKICDFLKFSSKISDFDFIKTYNKSKISNLPIPKFLAFLRDFRETICNNLGRTRANSSKGKIGFNSSESFM